jgi:hypothetical protein
MGEEMGIKNKLFILGILVFLLPITTIAKAEDDHLSATITEYGYYEFFIEPLKHEVDDSQPGYSQKRGLPILQEQTNKIPLKKGRLMAFYFEISGLPPELSDSIPLTATIDHPEFIKPDGSKSNQMIKESVARIIKGKAYQAQGYRFDHDYELVEGKWKFTIRYLNKTLLVQEFETFLPFPAYLFSR